MIRFLLALPALFFVFYFAHAGVKYTRMISHIFLSLVYNPPPEIYLPGPGEKISILDSADREIEAIFVERKNSDLLAIFCAESGADRESWEKYAYFLPSLGFNLLSLDFKTGKEEGEAQFLLQWPTSEDVGQVLTAIRWAKRAIRPDVRVVLFGVSKGADVALGASFKDPSIISVVADGLFSMKEIFRDYIRKWAPILVKPNLFGEKSPEWIVSIFSSLGFWYSQKKSTKKFVDVEKLLKKNHVPLLMIYGEKDEYIPVTHQKFLEKIGRKNSTDRLLVREARHNEAVILEKRLYEQKIVDFLKALL